MGGPGKPVSDFTTNLCIKVRIRIISSLARVQPDKLVQKENKESQEGLGIRAFEVMQGLQDPKVCKDMLEHLVIQEIKVHKASKGREVMMVIMEQLEFLEILVVWDLKDNLEKEVSGEEG